MTATAFQQKKSVYPLRFVPQYKDYLWGGDRIIRQFHRSAPPGIYAESWEASIRPEGQSVIANGPLAGTPLAELYPSFPLLLKLLDARETLSVQVHPDDAAAARDGGEPKTELWHILAADPGAVVYCGLKPGTDETSLRNALNHGDIVNLLEKIPVVAGDTIFVPGGRVHAIGGGCLILECQQNSNTTYRLYDWGRTSPDGKPRQLHIEQSIRSINWNETAPALLPQPAQPERGVNARQLLIDRPQFRIECITLNTPLDLEPAEKNHRLLFLSEGTIELRSAEFVEIAHPGTTYLLPANLPAVNLAPLQPSKLILITAPQILP